MARKKVGKNRLDKYYRLAKECGYRARSAFKLLQLDQKYNVLSGCTSVVDLCAAPGGWLQVLRERNIDLVVGVDLDPIRSIDNVECIVCDITTETCRTELLRAVGNTKVDLFLHDGAPNVGISWEQDSYTQNELVLHALKLSAEFLRNGGAFLTKVFRSKDYCSLLSVFNKVFHTVEATKPLSSRSESAEIFVYCKGFNGGKVEANMFDPNVVFKEEEETEMLNAIKVLKFADFLTSESPMSDLESFSRIDYQRQEDLDQVIDDDVRALFADLKLIGNADKKKILRRCRKVIRMIEKGEVAVEGAHAVPVSESLPNMVKQYSTEEKLGMIEHEIRKESKRERKREKKELKKRSELPTDAFFNDKMFDAEKRERKPRVTFAENVEEAEEISTCSDDMDLDEDEIATVVRLKENEEEFMLSTIDRYCNNDMKNLPDFMREEEREFGRRHIAASAPMSKETEAVSRRRKRAAKMTQKVVDKMQENDEGEDNTRKIIKSSFKKTRSKPRFVFSTKRGTVIPKGKGRIRFVDRRMRKDDRKSRARR